MSETEAFRKRIKALEEELKRAEDELRRTRIAGHRENYVGKVAHDLNNLLAGIITYPELILMELSEDSPLRKHACAIKQAGEKAADIVQDLMMLAHDPALASQALNLNEIISELRKSPDFKAMRAGRPDVKVVFDLEIPLDNIVGPSTHITKSLMNLLHNSVESINGQGRITVSTANRSVETPERGYRHMIEKGKYVTVTIQDTGRGMAEKDISRVFEPYYNKKVMGRGGSGLSMSVVWETIRQVNGYINIISALDRGTLITLYFPVTCEDKNRLAPPDDVVNCRGNGETMLIVDDMPEQRELACTILKKLGYSVSSVPSGEDAVEYLRTKRADMVILDMIMEPGIDGLETFKRISEFRPDQRFVIVSGYAETERLREIQRLGCRLCIKKPYSIAEIGGAVKKGLNAARA